MTYSALEQRRPYWTAPTVHSTGTTAEYWKMWASIVRHLKSLLQVSHYHTQHAIFDHSSNSAAIFIH